MVTAILSLRIEKSASSLVFFQLKNFASAIADAISGLDLFTLCLQNRGIEANALIYAANFRLAENSSFTK